MGREAAVLDAAVGGVIVEMSLVEIVLIPIVAFSETYTVCSTAKSGMHVLFLDQSIKTL